ncbi:hypothetical protein EC3006_0042, partial [Escherichia coli 3006]
MLLLGFVSR